MSPTQIAKSAHDQFMQIVRKELEAFEKREKEFLARERRERAGELKLAEQEPARIHEIRCETVKARGCSGQPLY